MILDNNSKSKARLFLLYSIIFLVVFFVAIILYLHHESMLSIERNQIFTIQKDLSAKARFMEYVLDNILTYNRELANSPETKNYFENLDLGMSKEYGLSLSLELLQQRLASFIESIKLGGIDLFQCVYVISKEGEMISQYGDNKEKYYDSIFTIIQHHQADSRWIVPFESEGEMGLASLSSIFVNGRERGFVVGIIDILCLLEALEARPDKGEVDLFFSMDGLYYPNLATKTRPSGEVNSHLSRFEAKISKHRLTLVRFIPDKLVKSKVGPTAITVVMGLLIAICIFLGFYLQKAHLRKEYLTLRLRESEEHQKELFSLTERLKKEVELRKEKEALLTEAQQALQEKVKEKTAELSHTLEQYKMLFYEYSKVLEHLPETIIVRDSEGKILLCNSNGDAPCIEAIIEKVFDTGKAFTTEIRGEDQKILELSLIPIRDEQGKIIRVLEVRRDITEKKEMEKRVMQTQKLEALGLMASGIAHDFNNILGGILGYAELGIRAKNDLEKVGKFLRQIVAGVERAKDLIAQILTFSRKEESKKAPVILQTIVKESYKMLRASIPANIGMELSVPKEPIKVLGDPVQIQQVIMNLCLNARDAVSDKGGHIKIALVPLEDKVALEVADNGHGIPEDVLPKIFDPYFTTKPAGKGTGLGLSVVFGIVKNMEGEITVKTKVGEGTTFTIKLPTVKSEYEAKVHDDLNTLKMGRGRIILVEDEYFMADVLNSMLKELGYEVETFTDPEQAFKRFRSNEMKFDLVITDLAMPKMSGLGLVQEIRKIDSKIPIIIVTGNIDENLERSGKELDISSVLRKPINHLELSKVVSMCLNRGTG